MGRRNKPKYSDNKITDRFVYIEYYVLNSLAYKALSTNARALLLEILKVKNGNNNGRIGFSVRTASESINRAINTARCALLELRKKGFIVCEKLGSFDNSKHGANRSSEWRITFIPHSNDQYSKSAEAPTKEFMKWRSEEDDFC